jgi:dipeptidyl aminopeptidase/acylaminoacyl peptidase
MREQLRSRFLIWFWMLALFPGAVRAEQQRALAPSDCIRVRYLLESDPHGPIRINRQGNRVGYVVESADLASNRVETQVFVRELANDDPSAAHLLVSGESISGIQWLGDGEHLSMLLRVDGIVSVVSLSILTGSIQVLARTDRDIVEFSISLDGSVIVFAVGENEWGSPYVNRRSPDELAQGYRVQLDQTQSDALQKRTLYVTRRTSPSSWSVPQRITIQDPFTKELLAAVAHYDIKIYALNLSLSPDGRRVLLSYVTKAVSGEWKSDPIVRFQLRGGRPAVITVLHDLSTGATTLPIKAIKTDGIPLWSPDSQSFVIAAPSPIGSKWERGDLPGISQGVATFHIFSVNVEKGEIAEVVDRVADPQKAILSWESTDAVILQVGRERVAEFSRAGGLWREQAHTDIPLVDLSGTAPMASDGNTIVGIRETPTEAPEVFSYGRSDGLIHMISNLNAFLREVTLAKTQILHWETSEGREVDGLLFLPPGYVPGKRYPLVIQLKQGNVGSFVCDSGSYHYPSVAPQPLANAGILYLERLYISPPSAKDTRTNQSGRYPGMVGEVVGEMDLWESAVRKLVVQGMVDQRKIGIIGFSRGGWYAEFLLTHSAIHFAAATAADNVQYTLGEYWLTHNTAVSQELASAFGGPPFGKTLRNWMEYSTSFSLERVHTPLMVEVMGYGVHDDIAGMIPTNLAIRYELLTGLTELGKAVEMYYYPDEDHFMGTPAARLRSMERNVDWYKFWLLDTERPDPEDRDQYVRWRRMRRHQDDVEGQN